MGRSLQRGGRVHTRFRFGARFSEPWCCVLVCLCGLPVLFLANLQLET